MKRLEHEINADFDSLFSDNEAFYEWLDSEAIYSWFEAQPIYKDRFIEWARRDTKLIEKWAEYVSEIVNQEGYNEPED